MNISSNIRRTNSNECESRQMFVPNEQKIKWFNFAQSIFVFVLNFLLKLAQAHDQIVVPLENFRKDRIGGVKEHKKKFDKKTGKFCQAQERFLNMSSKKPDNTIQEVSDL